MFVPRAAIAFQIVEMAVKCAMRCPERVMGGEKQMVWKSRLEASVVMMVVVRSRKHVVDASAVAGQRLPAKNRPSMQPLKLNSTEILDADENPLCAQPSG